MGRLRGELGVKFRVGGLRAPLWGVVGSRERERGDLRRDASLRLSGEGPGTGANLESVTEKMRRFCLIGSNNWQR